LQDTGESGCFSDASVEFTGKEAQESYVRVFATADKANRDLALLVVGLRNRAKGDTIPNHA
jgi:hypothetical protein